MEQTALFSERDVYTPQRLNREVRFQLEAAYRDIWIEGEISNLSQPASGHSYFTLKDESAQVRCALFRNRRVAAALTDGMQILLRARVSVYEARGEYQLIVEYAEEAGEGRLRRQFEELKKKLAAEGLFDPGSKKQLPRFPRHIAIVSSATGAAIRDVVSVLKRRFPIVRVTLIPSAVQGEQAPSQLNAALETALRLKPDVILLTRGGGSLEDLWAFNDESLARAIFRAETPIISAVGHEVDFTISDFVADIRAPTPSAAAELMVPDQSDLQQSFESIARHLNQNMESLMQRRMQQVDYLHKRLQGYHPGERIRNAGKSLVQNRGRLAAALQLILHQNQSRLREQQTRLNHQDPRVMLCRHQEVASQLETRLAQHLRARLSLLTERLRGQVKALNAVSPLAVLERGYSMTQDQNGVVLRSVKGVAPGDRIQTRLSLGMVISEVLSVEGQSSD